VVKPPSDEAERKQLDLPGMSPPLLLLTGRDEAGEPVYTSSISRRRAELLEQGKSVVF
jgi:hypothetical protein